MLLVFLLPYIRLCLAISDPEGAETTPSEKNTDDLVGSTETIPGLGVKLYFPRNLTNAKPLPINLDCDNLESYYKSCDQQAKELYNSSRLPAPNELNAWCSSIRLRTICAMDWNEDCKDVTYSAENVNGHIHVLNNICDDDTFPLHYHTIGKCRNTTIRNWERCYYDFISVLLQHKNDTKSWTHYETHFTLCCARARFRSCTLAALFRLCDRMDAITLQKFSVIVSEGEVYQNCDNTMQYASCEGGDPRPSFTMLQMLTDRNPSHRLEPLATRTLCLLSSLIMYGFIKFDGR